MGRWRWGCTGFVIRGMRIRREWVRGDSFTCGSTRMGLGRLRGLLVMTIMRPSEGKAKSETGKAKATVTEKTHPCKNQTRKDGAPDPKRKAKSEKRKAKSEKREARSGSLTPLAQDATRFPSTIGP